MSPQIDVKREKTAVKKFFKEFMDFAMKGNVINLAVGVVIGGAFNTIVTSLVSDIIMPLVGLLTGGQDFSGLFIALDGGTYATLAEATSKNVATLNYGSFLQNVINFLIMALSLFVAIRAGTAVAKRFHILKEKEEPPKHLCPFCQMEISEKATKCPYCTAELPQGTAGAAKA